jgi:hypothetical protein
MAERGSAGSVGQKICLRYARSGAGVGIAMSGPIDERDQRRCRRLDAGVIVRESRIARVGTMGVVRALPTKGRRTIGAWCLVDAMVPGDAIEPDPLEIGPHPHIGLSTVTWLLEGEALHSDSLGTEQIIRPGQLNLMTAGNGIAHAELSADAGVLGLQMWIAQPEATRHGVPAFEHHAALPVVELGAGRATVLVGGLGDAASPARSDTPLIGADLDLAYGHVEIEADPTFEYGIVPLKGRLKINDYIIEPGLLGLVPTGTDALRVETLEAGTRALLIGGEPLGERVQMWWNFVARTRDELTDAWRDWQAGDTDRFPEFRSVLDRIEAPRPMWLRTTD